MGRETAIDQLSPEHKELLENRLKRGFNGYVELAEWLQTEGYKISKSSVHRYGQKLEKKLAAIQASTQAALMIVGETPDEGNARSEAVLSLVQTGMFNALIQMQEASENQEIDPEKQFAMYTKAGKGIAEIVKASVLQKQHAIDVREKAKLAAKEVETIVKSSGLSDETADLIRAKILGIAE